MLHHKMDAVGVHITVVLDYVCFWIVDEDYDERPECPRQVRRFRMCS